MSSLPEPISVKEAAAMIGRSEKAVYNMAYRGKLPRLSTGDARVMFDRAAITHYLKTMTDPAAKSPNHRRDLPSVA